MSWSSFLNFPILITISWLSSVFFCCPVPVCPSPAVLPQMSCPSCLDTSLLSPAHLSLLLCPCCHVMAFLSSLPCPGWLVRQTYPYWSPWAVLSNFHTFITVCLWCFIPTVLSWLSYRLSCSSCPFSTILPFLPQHPCPQPLVPRCPVFVVMFSASSFVLDLCLGCPVPADLYRLSCSLSCPGCQRLFGHGKID